MDNEINKKLAKLGLNKTQIKAYLYVLENRGAFLKDLAKEFNLTKAAISKIFNDLETIGLIKSCEHKGIKVFLVESPFRSRDKIIQTKKDELMKFRDALDELIIRYGHSKIRIRQLNDVQLAAVTSEEIIDNNKKIFLFHDFRKEVPLQRVPKKWRSKNFIMIYFYNNKNLYDFGKKFYCDKNKLYASIVSAGGRTKITTDYCESMEIASEEIANTVQLLIKIIHDAKDLGEWEHQNNGK